MILRMFFIGTLCCVVQGAGPTARFHPGSVRKPSPLLVRNECGRTLQAGRAVNDLHVEYLRAAAGGSKAPPCADSGRTGTRHDFTGASIAAGGRVTNTWINMFAADIVTSAYWTADGEQVGNELVGLGKTSLFFREAGDGQLAAVAHNQGDASVTYTDLAGLRHRGRQLRRRSGSDGMVGRAVDSVGDPDRTRRLADRDSSQSQRALRARVLLRPRYLDRPRPREARHALTSVAARFRTSGLVPEDSLSGHAPGRSVGDPPATLCGRRLFRRTRPITAFGLGGP